MIDLSNEIKAYALKNAIEFGKADVGRILPKLFQHGLDKKDVKEIMPLIQKIVQEVNGLNKKDRAKEFEKLNNLVKVRVEEERKLAELPEVSDKMVFRLAPYPSGALHLGNAKTYLLNALYAEKYKAKLLLMMDDTIGSDEKGISPEAYVLVQDAFDWLGVKYEKPVLYKSDRLGIYYKYGEELIKKDKAYVCHCPQEVLKKNREQAKDCECRNLAVDEQMRRWKEMFSAPMGFAVVRLKTSMQHPNPAFRDRVLFKISDKEHPRVGKKYRVWPSLEMNWAIDDHELGITHILRGNDLMIETDMEKFIWDIFGWKHPVTMHAGLIKIEGIGAKISKSKAQKEVISGEFTGWDDPRTWSMQSLQRRGIRPEAVRAFVEEIGLNKQDITVPIEALYAHNRKIIDQETQRYYFVENPIELEIQDAPEIFEIKVPVHPDKPNTTRTIDLSSRKIFISTQDFDELGGKEIRLLHLYNIDLSTTTVDGRAAAKFTSEANKNIPKIQWVCNGQRTRVLMPDGKWIEGVGDEHIRELKEGDVIQFERFGFCRLDGVKDDVSEFWFSHK